MPSAAKPLHTDSAGLPPTLNGVVSDVWVNRLDGGIGSSFPAGSPVGSSITSTVAIVACIARASSVRRRIAWMYSSARSSPPAMIR